MRFDTAKTHFGPSPFTTFEYLPLISVLDEDLVPSFADRRQQGDQEDDRCHDEQGGAHQMADEARDLPARDDSARLRFSSISLPSTKPSSIGASSKPSLISA